MQSFTSPAPNVTETGYPNLSVLANWSGADTYTTAGYGVAPTAFLARSRDGALVAGTFSGTFDGLPLSAGRHDLVVSRRSSAVLVHQPLGGETQLGIRLPSSWQAGRPVHATALAANGEPLGPVEGTVRDGRFLFTCGGPSAGAPAPTYRLSSG